MKFTNRQGNIVNDILVVTGSQVFNVNGGDSATTHSWSQVQQLFFDKYGIKPTLKNGVHIEGGTYSNGNGFYAVCDSQPNGDVHIVFAYLYDTSKGFE